MLIALFYVIYQSYFQHRNLDWDISFSNSSIVQNWDFLSVGVRLYFQVFAINQEILGFLNVTLAGLLNFFQFMKKMKNWVFLV